jgi:hypothetical protein
MDAEAVRLLKSIHFTLEIIAGTLLTSAGFAFAVFMHLF